MFNKTVECSYCKHIVRKQVAQAIKFSGRYCGSGTRYYCPEHRVEYEFERNWDYYKTFQVSWGGEPVGYVKVALVDEVALRPETKTPKKETTNKKK